MEETKETGLEETGLEKTEVEAHRRHATARTLLREVNRKPVCSESCLHQIVMTLHSTISANANVTAPTRLQRNSVRGRI